MESLSFDTAYRYSDYGDGVQTDTYKLGLEWAPVQDVRLRGSYQRAVRAANIVELFTAQGLNLFDAPGDPCGAAARDPEASDEECIASGVPAGLVGAPSLDSPAAQYYFQQGGTADLTPEESDTYSYGIVFTPRFAPGLAITVDYFDIRDRRHDLDLRRQQHLDRVLCEQRSGGVRAHQSHARNGPAVDEGNSYVEDTTSTSDRWRPRATTST